MPFGESPTERSQRAQIKQLRVALKSLTEFAWSTMTPDCDEARRELTRRLDRARAILAADA